MHRHSHAPRITTIARVPCTLLQFIPVVGPTALLGVEIYIAWHAQRFHLPKWRQALIAWNLVFDYCLGVVPGLGIVLTSLFKVSDAPGCCQWRCAVPEPLVVLLAHHALRAALPAGQQAQRRPPVRALRAGRSQQERGRDRRGAAARLPRREPAGAGARGGHLASDGCRGAGGDGRAVNEAGALPLPGLARPLAADEWWSIEVRRIAAHRVRCCVTQWWAMV